MTRIATPWSESLISHSASSSRSACFPIRIGGFDQIRSTVMSAGTLSGCKIVTETSFAAAFAAVSSRALLLGSTATTIASGDLSARVSAMGPAPHPTSTKVPVAGGGGACCSKKAVPLSRCPWLKTPRSVVKVKARSGSTTSTVRGSRAASGASSK